MFSMFPLRSSRSSCLSRHIFIILSVLLATLSCPCQATESLAQRPISPHPPRYADVQSFLSVRQDEEFTLQPEVDLAEEPATAQFRDEGDGDLSELDEAAAAPDEPPSPVEDILPPAEESDLPAEKVDSPAEVALSPSAEEMAVDDGNQAQPSIGKLTPSVGEAPPSAGEDSSMPEDNKLLDDNAHPSLAVANNARIDHGQFYAAEAASDMSGGLLASVQGQDAAAHGSGPFAQAAAATAPNNRVVSGVAEAKNRRKCADIVNEYKRETAHEGRHGKMWLRSFMSLYISLIKKVNRDSDKLAKAALESLKTATRFSPDLDFEVLHQLMICSVDEVGRTVLMKVIERGLIMSVHEALIWESHMDQSGSEKLTDLVDALGHNIVHLAVLSRSNEMLGLVLGKIASKAAPEDVVKFLNDENLKGEKPLDLARYPSVPSGILQNLKDFYRAHHFERPGLEGDDESAGVEDY